MLLLNGFETRGTFRSGERLALEHLFNAAAIKQELLLSSSQRRIKRSAANIEAVESTTINSFEADNFTINYDDYGVDDDNETITPCGMYVNLGKPILPYILIDGSVKAIFEVESFEKLFEVSTLKDLCKLDNIIDQVIKETDDRDFVSPAPFSFNLPNYVMCANGSYIKKCEDLDQKTADAFKSVVVTCLNPKTEAEILNCETNFATQIRDYILQIPNPPHQIPEGPIYVGAVLKLYSNLAIGASPESSNKFFTALLDRLSNNLGDKMKLKGLFVGSKNAFFEEALYSDIILGGGALAMVILGIFFYSKSFAFTCIVLCGMAFAVGTSFFVYTAIFRISFFPFINFLVIVIAIAVGADDAFLLSYQFEKHKTELKQWNAKLLNFDPDLMSQKDKLGYSYTFNETIDFGALDLQVGKFYMRDYR
uniref:Uncharacterized protein n=1 Tax=Panagrolaimus sp. ES5 TaxID=591445 RepID=A0AC34GSW0_9BILA